MTTITRERLQEVIDGDILFTDEQRELARIALASLTADPALYAAEETLAYANMGELHLTCLSEPMGDAVIPLYTAPPAPVVPDRSMFETWWESQNGSPFDSWDSLRTTDGYCDDGIDGQFEAWNACRAALLQGSQPVTTDYKLPEGWVAVPVEPTMAMLDEFDSIIDYGAEDSKDAWSRLIAAAPQQEVRP